MELAEKRTERILIVEDEGLTAADFKVSEAGQPKEGEAWKRPATAWNPRWPTCRTSTSRGRRRCCTSARA